MIEEIYRQALDRMRAELATAQVPHTEDEGELILGGRRLGLAIRFEGFLPQGTEWLAPLEIQLCLDGIDPERFTVGTVGAGRDQAAAMGAALEEWTGLAALPVLAALDPRVAGRRAATLAWGGWRGFPGRAGLRGRVPSGLKAESPLYRMLLAELESEVRDWTTPPRDDLRCLAVVASWAEGQLEVVAAIDGRADARLVERVRKLAWPQTIEPWLFKQLFVVRNAAFLGGER